MTGWDGTAYRRVNTLQQWLAERVLAGLDLGGARSILDVGCGDGRITAEIADRWPGAEVVGLDPSPAMIEVAPTGPRVRFVVGGVLEMAFQDAFDAVVSFNALHWVPQQEAALNRVAVALRRPGRAVLVLVCAGSRRSVEQVAMDTTRRPEWVELFDGFAAPFVHPEPAAYASAAERSGLHVADLRVDDLSWDFGSAEAFRRWFAVGSTAWTSRLPDAGSRDRFVGDVAAGYAGVTGSDRVLRFMQMRVALAT